MYSCSAVYTAVHFAKTKIDYFFIKNLLLINRYLGTRVPKYLSTGTIIMYFLKIVVRRKSQPERNGSSTATVGLTGLTGLT